MLFQRDIVAETTGNFYSDLKIISNDVTTSETTTVSVLPSNIYNTQPLITGSVPKSAMTTAILTDSGSEDNTNFILTDSGMATSSDDSTYPSTLTTQISGSGSGSSFSSSSAYSLAQSIKSSTNGAGAVSTNVNGKLAAILYGILGVSLLLGGI